MIGKYFGDLNYANSMTVDELYEAYAYMEIRDELESKQMNK